MELVGACFDWNMALGADMPLNDLASAQTHCGHAVYDYLFWYYWCEPSEVQTYPGRDRNLS